MRGILVSVDAQTPARGIRINPFFTLVFDKRDPRSESTGLELNPVCPPTRSEHNGRLY